MNQICTQENLYPGLDQELEPFDFEVSIRNRCLGLPEVKIQQNTAFWKAESLRNPISREFAPDEASIESYGDFESDRSAVRRLRRRAPGGKGARPIHEMAEWGNKQVGDYVKRAKLRWFDQTKQIWLLRGLPGVEIQQNLSF